MRLVVATRMTVPKTYDSRGQGRSTTERIAMPDTPISDACWLPPWHLPSWQIVYA